VKKTPTQKLTLSRESLRLLDGPKGERLILGDPETQVGHSCDSFCH